MGDEVTRYILDNVQEYSLVHEHGIGRENLMRMEHQWEFYSAVSTIYQQYIKESVPQTRT